MNYLLPTKFLNHKDYEYIVSIGNKCPTTMILKDLNIYTNSFPFDYIPTTPYLILKYIQNQDEFYPEKNIIRTKDNVWFGHFNLNDKYDETIEMFKRRFERLFYLLKNKKKILFVYTSEADIYNEMNNRYNDNYNQLSKLVEYITQTYKYDNFKLLCIHTNKSFNDTKNIINFTINVPDKFLSDDNSTHNDEVCLEYRTNLKNLLKNIFKL
jgi:hypothetical protein